MLNTIEKEYMLKEIKTLKEIVNTPDYVYTRTTGKHKEEVLLAQLERIEKDIMKIKV